jgi:hypothetical protein
MNAYCERIICLSDPGQAPDWWLAYQDAETPPLFVPDGRIGESPLDKTGEAVQKAVAEGYRPHLFVPRASDWPAVYDALGPYRDFAQIWICGRDDRIMAELLQRPSAEVREAERTDDDLVVPNPEYGKALDWVLETRLEDFHPDASAPQTAPDRTQTPWVTAEVRASRLNPFRILEIALDRVEGALTLSQSYVTADPASPPEPCDREVSLAGGARLQFKQGCCSFDRTQGTEVAAVCQWLGVRPLRMLADPAMVPAPVWWRGLTEFRDRLLRELEMIEKKGDFLRWMGAWSARYFGGTSLPSTPVRPVQWATRALEEVIREFDLARLLAAMAAPQPVMGVGAMRGAGAERRSAGDQPLEERLSDVAKAYRLEGDETDKF